VKFYRNGVRNATFRKEMHLPIADYFLISSSPHF
jgi:hypothetical protein